jgi:hypothetical protein
VITPGNEMTAADITQTMALEAIGVAAQILTLRAAQYSAQLRQPIAKHEARP